jgi:hypothetical protein
VTFPNPDYKQKAIQRGTHFEQNPTKEKPNLDFQGDQPSPAAPVKEPTGKDEPVQVEPASGEKKSTLFQPEPPTPDKTKTVAPNLSTQDDLANRSPEQKAQDAQEVNKILTTEFTLDEAKEYGWIRDQNNKWYNSDGVLKGREWYCVESHQRKILSIQ